MTIYGLFTGQSNAVGGISVGGPFDIISTVKVWNNAPNTYSGSIGSSWITPDRNAAPFLTGGNNQGVHAAHYLSKYLNEDGRLVITGDNGQSINIWHNGSIIGPMYEYILDILDATGQTAMDWFGWNHGSADEPTYTTYHARWDAMIAQMESDGIITSSTPIFITETAHAPLINGVLEEIAEDDPRVGYARIGSYPTIDGAHFTGVAQAYAGYEAVRALSEIEGPFEGLIDTSATYMPLSPGFAQSRR